MTAPDDERVDKLIEGLILVKHGKRGSPHPRFVFVSKRLDRVSWRAPDGKEADTKHILLADVTDVLEGEKSQGASFKKLKPAGRVYKCLSLVSAQRSLDLECVSEKQRDELVQAFRVLTGPNAFALERARNAIDTEIVPIFRERIEQVTGASVAIECDWESFKAAPDPVPIVEMLGGPKSLGKLALLMEKMAQDADAKQGIIDHVKRIRLVLKAKADVLSSFDADEGVLFDFIVLNKKIPEGVEFSTPEVVQSVLAEAVRLKARQTKRRIEKELAEDGKIASRLEAALGKCPAIKVDWPAFMAASNEVLALEKITSASVLGKVLTVLEAQSQDDIGKRDISAGVSTIEVRYSKGDPDTFVNDGVLVEAFELSQQGEYRGTDKDMCTAAIERAFSLKEQRLRKHVSDTVVQQHRDRLAKATGKDVAVDIDWDSFGDAPVLLLAYDLVRSPHVLGKITSVLEAVASHDGLSKEALHDNISTVKVQFTAPPKGTTKPAPKKSSKESKESKDKLARQPSAASMLKRRGSAVDLHRVNMGDTGARCEIQESTLLFVFTVGKAVEDRLDAPSDEDLVALLESTYRLVEKRRMAHMRKVDAPQLAEQVRRVTGRKDLELDIDWDSIDQCPATLDALDAVFGDQVVGRLVRVLEEMCADPIARSAIATVVQCVAVHHAGDVDVRPAEDRLPPLDPKNGTLKLPFQVDPEAETPLFAASAQNTKEVITAGCDIDVRRMVHVVDHEHVGRFTERIKTVVGKPVPIEIDWKSVLAVASAKDRLNAARMVPKELVLEKITKVIEDTCSDPVGLKAVKENLSSIKVRHVGTDDDDVAKSKFEAGVLTDSIEVGEHCPDGIHAFRYSDLRKMLISALGLRALRASNTIQKKLIPVYAARFSKALKTDVAVEVDVDSFEGAPDKQEAFRKVGSDYILGKIARTVEEFCVDKIAPASLFQKFQKVVIKYKTSGDQAACSYLKGGVLYDVFETGAEHYDNIDCSSREQLSKYLDHQCRVTERRQLKAVNEYISMFSEYLEEQLALKVSFEVPTDTFIAGPDHAEAVKNLHADISAGVLWPVVNGLAQLVSPDPDGDPTLKKIRDAVTAGLATVRVENEPAVALAAGSLRSITSGSGAIEYQYDQAKPRIHMQDSVLFVQAPFGKDLGPLDPADIVAAVVKGLSLPEDTASLVGNNSKVRRMSTPEDVEEDMAEEENRQRSLLYSAYETKCARLVEEARLKSILVAGATLQRHKKGAASKQFVFCSDKLDSLHWGDDRKKAKESILLADVTDVVPGCGSGEFAKGTNEDLALSLLSPQRTVDLVAGTAEERQDWVKALKLVVIKKVQQLYANIDEIKSNILPTYSKQLDQMLGTDGFKISIDWDSFAKIEDQGKSVGKLGGPHVLGRLVTAIRTVCSDEVATKAFSKCIDEVVVRYRQKRRERTTIKERKLIDIVELNPKFADGLDVTPSVALQTLIETAIGVRVKRLQHRLETVALEDYGKRIEGVVGKRLKISVDWASFSSARSLHEQMLALETVASKFVLGKLASVLEEACRDEIGKTAVATDVDSILIRFADGKEPSTSSVRESKLVEVFGISKNEQIVTTGPADWRLILERTFMLPEKRLNHSINTELVPMYEEKLRRATGTSIAVYVDWASFAEAQSLMVAYEALAGPSVLQKLVAAVLSECRDETGKAAITAGIERVVAKFGTSKEDVKVVVEDKALVDTFTIGKSAADLFFSTEEKRVSSRLVSTFDLHIKRLKLVLEEQEIPAMMERLQRAVGKAIKLTVDWTSFDKAEDTFAALSTIAGPQVGEKLLRTIEELCSEAVGRKALATSLGTIRIVHYPGLRKELDSDPDKSGRRMKNPDAGDGDGIFYECVEVFKDTDGRPQVVPVDAKRTRHLLEVGCKLPTHRAILATTEEHFPAFEKRLATATGGAVAVKADWASFLKLPNSEEAVKMVVGEHVLEKITKVVEDACMEASARDTLKAKLKTVSIQHAKPDDAVPKPRIDGDRLVDVIEVSSKHEDGIQCYQRGEMRKFVISAFNLRERKAIHTVQKKVVPMYKARLSKCLKEAIEVELEVSSFDHADDKQEAFRKVASDYVLGKVARAIEEICVDDIGSSSLLQKFSKVVIKYRSSEDETKPANFIRDRCLYDLFQIGDEFFDNIECSSRDQIREFLETECRVTERRMLRDVREKYVPLYGDRFIDITGGASAKPLPISVNYESFWSSSGHDAAVHTLFDDISAQVLWPIVVALSHIADTETAKEELAKGLVGVEIRNADGTDAGLSVHQGVLEVAAPFSKCAPWESVIKSEDLESVVVAALKIDTTGCKRKASVVNDEQRQRELLLNAWEVKQERLAEEQRLRSKLVNGAMMVKFAKGMSNKYFVACSPKLDRVQWSEGTAAKPGKVKDALLLTEISEVVAGTNLEFGEKSPPAAELCFSLVAPNAATLAFACESAEECQDWIKAFQMEVGERTRELQAMIDEIKSKIVPDFEARINQKLGASIKVEVDFASFGQAKEQGLAVSKIDGPYVLQKIESAIEKVCHDDIAKGAFLEKIKGIKIVYRSQPGQQSKLDPATGTLVDVMEINQRYPDSIDCTSSAMLQSLIESATAVKARRVQQSLVANAIPEFAKRIQNVVGKAIAIEVEWASYERIQDIGQRVAAMQAITTKYILGKLAAMLEDACKDDLGKDAVVAGIDSIVIAFAGEDSAAAVQGSLVDGKLHEVYLMDHKAKSVQCRGPNEWRNTLEAKFQLRGKRLRRQINEKVLVAIGDKIHRAVGQKVEVEIDWPSFDKAALLELALETLVGKHVLGKIVSIIESECADQIGKQTVGEGLRRVKVRFSGEPQGNEVAFPAADTVEEVFWTGDSASEMHCVSEAHFRQAFENHYGLKSKRVQREVSTKSLPKFRERIDKITGKSILLQVDWESFEKSDKSAPAMQAITGEQVAGRIIRLLEDLCHDAVGKAAVAEALHSVVIRYSPGLFEKPEAERTVPMANGVYTEQLEICVDTDGKDFLVLADAKSSKATLAAGVDLPMRRGIAKLTQDKLPPIIQKLRSITKKTIVVDVAWPSMSGRLAALGHIEPILTMVSEVLSSCMTDDLGKMAVTVCLDRIRIEYREDSDKERCSMTENTLLICFETPQRVLLAPSAEDTKKLIFATYMDIVRKKMDSISA